MNTVQEFSVEEVEDAEVDAAVSSSCFRVSIVSWCSIFRSSWPRCRSHLSIRYPAVKAMSIVETGWGVASSKANNRSPKTTDPHAHQPLVALPIGRKTIHNISPSRKADRSHAETSWRKLRIAPPAAPSSTHWTDNGTKLPTQVTVIKIANSQMIKKQVWYFIVLPIMHRLLGAYLPHPTQSPTPYD